MKANKVVHPIPLTRDQAEGLRRIRDKGSLAWASGRGRAGGAVSRMFGRMVVQGLASGPPYEITSLGRLSLDRYDELRRPRK